VQKTWTRIWPLFKREFATTSDDKLIVDGLANLAHKQGENPRKFFSRLEKLFNILHENYASYRVKPECPAQLPAGNYSEDVLTNMPMITSRHTINFSLPKSSKRQLCKMFVNCCRTRIKHASL